VPGVGGRQQVGAAPRRAEQDEHVATAPVGLDLPGERRLEAVVVGDGRDGGGLGVQGQGTERRAVVAVAADQLGGEVLAEGGAAAVAGDEHPAPGGQPHRQVGGPRLDGGQVVLQVADGADRLVEVVQQVGAGVGVGAPGDVRHGDERHGGHGRVHADTAVVVAAAAAGRAARGASRPW
jgi:hypothetical protein